MTLNGKKACTRGDFLKKVSELRGVVRLYMV
jgi:hypothetical protein